MKWLLAMAIASAFAASGAGAAPLRDCADCPELIEVPSGVFVMGSLPEEPQRLGLNEYWGERERPRRDVRVDQPFALGRTEVTRGQFAAFVAATGYAPEPGCWRFEGDEWRLNAKGSWRDPGFPQTDDHPVTCVNWHDASAYAAWLGQRTSLPYRLPSEAEWEYAARAVRTTAWWWGDDAAQVCNFINLGDIKTREATDWASKRINYAKMSDWKGEPCSDGFAFTAPVASFPANPFGFHDLGGNANEWVADCWNNDYTGAPSDQSARITSGDCHVRAMRGQGWTAVAAGTRAAFRLKMNAGDRRFTFGFRVARDIAARPKVAARFVKGAGGVPLSVREAGPVGAPPLLFLHGLGQGAASFAPQFAGLSDRYRIIAFDLRGHGLSGKPLGKAAYLRRGVWAEDIRQVMRATGAEKPILVAWSFGTLAAMDYVRRYGDSDLSGIVLVSALGGLAQQTPSGPSEALPEAMLQARALQRSPLVEEQLEAARLIGQYLSAEPAGDGARQISTTLGAMVPPQVRAALLQTPSDNRDLVGRIGAPVLIIGGGKDGSLQPATAMALAAGLPGAEAEIRPNLGHSPFSEDPQWFNERLTRFVEDRTK